MSRDFDDIMGLLKASKPELFLIFVAKDLHMVPGVSFHRIDVCKTRKRNCGTQDSIELSARKSRLIRYG